MTDRIIGLILALLVVVSFLVSLGCENRKLVKHLEREYHPCKVVKLEDDGAYTEATLQCGPTLKVVKVKRGR